MSYELKQGSMKEAFTSGAVRDAADDKPRLDLLSPVFLYRMGDLAREGGKHYGDRNWEKGMPLSRILASAFRHLVQTLDGQEDEDHAIQCAFNLMMYVHTLHRIRTGSLPIKLDDVCREQNLVKKNLEATLTSDKKPGSIVPCCHKCYRPIPQIQLDEPMITFQCKCGEGRSDPPEMPWTDEALKEWNEMYGDRDVR